MARFGETSLEAAKNFLEDNKVIDQFVQNTVYCRVTNMLKFHMGVLGNQLCVNSNEGQKVLLGNTREVSSGTSRRLKLAIEPKCCGRTEWLWMMLQCCQPC